MAKKKKVTIDPALPIDVNVASMSPHVVVYQLWIRSAASGTWAKPSNAASGAGRTDDGVPDHQPIGTLPKGGQLDWILAIGGNAGTHFKVMITISQGGKVCAGGACLEEGKTSAKGHAVAETEVTFQ